MNITIIALILSFAPFHAACMDQPLYPQLPLELPSSKKTNHVKGVLYIADELDSAFLAPKQYHNNVLDRTSLKASYGEPFIMTKIRRQENTSDGWRILLPAKYLWNMNNGSKVKFTYPAEEETFNEYCFELQCAKNPQLEGSFQQQFSECMNQFYNTPYFMDEHAQEFIDNDLISNAQNNLSVGIHPSTGSLFVVAQKTAKHGSKGISSEKKFIEMMQEEKTAPFKKSAFQFVMQRQMGNTRQTTSTKQPQLMPIADIVDSEDFQPIHGRPEDEYGRHGNQCILL